MKYATKKIQILFLLWTSNLKFALLIFSLLPLDKRGVSLKVSVSRCFFLAIICLMTKL